METEKKKLTDNQLRLVQGVAGAVCAAVMMITMSIPDLSTYAFLATFVVIMIGPRWVERKYRLRLNFFSLVLLNGIMVGILIMLISNLYYSDKPLFTSEPLKLLVIIGVALIIVVLGFTLPLLRYKKRREKGEVKPIRIPEKTEEEQEKENRSIQNNGHSSIAQQIAEMARELEEKDKENK